MPATLRLVSAVVSITAGHLLAPNGAGKIVPGARADDLTTLLEIGDSMMDPRVGRERYFWCQHNAGDTPDKVDPNSLAQCAASMAVMVYAVAEIPERRHR